MLEEMRSKIGGVSVEDAVGADNLAVVLCIYFTDHMGRPDDDPETEYGWGEWVEQKSNEALDLIAKSLTPNAAVKPRRCIDQYRSDV